MKDKNEAMLEDLKKFPIWEIVRTATALALHDQADDERNGLPACVELSELKEALFNAKFQMFASPEVEWWWSLEDAIAHHDECGGGPDAV